MDEFGGTGSSAAFNSALVEVGGRVGEYTALARVRFELESIRLLADQVGGVLNNNKEASGRGTCHVFNVQCAKCGVCGVDGSVLGSGEALELPWIQISRG